MKIYQIIQKHIGTVGIIAYALLFIYALVMATPCSALIYYPNDINGVKAPDFYKQVQPMNNTILILAIFGIVLSLIYGLLRNKDRKVYFASNFVWFITFIVFSIVTCVITLIDVSKYHGIYNTLDFTTINDYFSERNLDKSIDPNSGVFAFGYVFASLVGVLSVPSIVLLVNKIIGRIGFEKSNSVTSDKIADLKEEESHE